MIAQPTNTGQRPRVLIVSEYYPRANDPTLGIWAHRQAVAAQAAGAEVRVLVLYRPVPSREDLASRDPARIVSGLKQPLFQLLDGVKVSYVPFIAPERSRSYDSWAEWAAPSLALYIKLIRRRFKFDLLHAHYAAPAGAAALHCKLKQPLVVSIHGGDVLHLAEQSERGHKTVSNTLERAAITLANSRLIADRCQQLGATNCRVLHLGTDLPKPPFKRFKQLTISSLGNLIKRKRHGDVIRALWLLRERHPDLRYEIVGDGPELQNLKNLSRELGLQERVNFTGRLPHTEALAHARRAHICALPSTEEAFGVSYIELMAAELPAIGSAGEPGPIEIASLGKGMCLVPPGDVELLAQQISTLVADDQWRRELGSAARQTVQENFSWDLCGKKTLEIYRQFSSNLA